jgi:hypothetical protein
MTDVPPQDQPPRVDSGSPDETERPDRTRRVSLPPDSQAASTRRRPSQQRSRRRRAQPRSSSAARAAPPPQASYPAPVQQPAPQRRARRAAPPPSTPPSQSGLYVPWWSLVVMVMIVGGIAFGMVFLFAQWSEPQTPGDQPPRIQIITSQPTLSQDFGGGADGEQGSSDFWPTTIPQAQPTATVPLPTPVPSPSLPPGNFTIGARVMVVGVGTSGLNVRSAPGLTGNQLFLAYDDETYALVDGPQTADGLEWWKIEDPNDPARVGWAARNYLTVQ